MKKQDVLFMDLYNFELSRFMPFGKIYIDWAPIEISIAEAISILNKKGYFTVLCCQGHIPKTNGDVLLSRMRQCYICFRNDILIDTFPQGFVQKVIKMGVYNNTIISNVAYNYTDDQGHLQCKTDDRIEQELLERNYNLLQWAMSLAEYQVMSEEGQRISM